MTETLYPDPQGDTLSRAPGKEREPQPCPFPVSLWGSLRPESATRTISPPSVLGEPSILVEQPWAPETHVPHDHYTVRSE